MGKVNQINYETAWVILKRILNHSLEIAEITKSNSTTEYEFIVSQLRIDFNADILKKMQAVEDDLREAHNDRAERF